MSVPVRIPDRLHQRIEELATSERRSVANMVAVLLEQALEVDDEPRTKETVVAGGLGVAQTTTTLKNERKAEDHPHFKPDFK